MNNRNHNDDYNKNRSKLDECSNIFKYIFVQGATGPTGPSGVQGLIGEQGPTGPQGVKGEQGDPGISEGALYNSLVFVDIPETTVSGIATIGDSKKVPNTNEYFTINNNRNISILNAGVYEITVSGKITGVTSTVGASFYLYDVTNDKKISNLTFELKKGNITEMNFSKIKLLEINSPVELQLKTKIENNASSDVTFSDISILIKKYNIQ